MSIVSAHFHFLYVEVHKTAEKQYFLPPLWGSAIFEHRSAGLYSSPEKISVDLRLHLVVPLAACPQRV